VRHASTANCSSLGLASLNQPSPGTWLGDVDLQVSDGGPFCETTLRTSPPWICSWSRPLGFKLLYGFVIVRIDRRDLVWINVTTNPTAEWIARQITEAFPWDGAPGYMIRDHDRVYGTVVTRRLRAMGIRDNSPWQNGFAERLIGSIRRECSDHVIVLGEEHLGQILEKLCGLLQWRENASVSKQRCAGLSAGSAIRRHKSTRPLGRLHHRYARV